MKKILLIMALSFLFVPCVTPGAWSDEIDPHVSVTGNAYEEVTPDEMFWTLSIINRGDLIKDITYKHANIVKGVIAFLDRAGIDKDNLQTSMMQFGENWEHINGRRVKKGYFSSSRIAFKLTDFSNYQDLWDGLSKFEGMSIQNIEYGYSREIEARDKARVKALLAAREKAMSMAKTLGVTLGAPLIIEDTQPYFSPSRTHMLVAREAVSMADSRTSEAGYSLGKIKITSTVKVVFDIVE